MMTQAEEELLAQAVNYHEEARTGRGPGKELITRENIDEVLIMLHEPTSAMVARAEKEGVRSSDVCGFEIVGDYCLPETERAKHII